MSNDKKIMIGIGALVLIMSIEKKPRGLRLNNPLNIKEGNDWQGEAIDNDKTFESFKDLALGIRAGVIVLINYYQLHGLDTIAKQITRFAPKTENATQNYINYVAGQVGIGANYSMSEQEFIQILPKLVRAMINMEQGSAYSWALVSDKKIEQGVMLALNSKGLLSA